jgi:DNA-binding MarR family transcriptional regulator
MNPSTIKIDDHRRFAADQQGCLYDPQIRQIMGERVGPEVLHVVEALAAIRYAAKLMHLAMERWADKQGLSEGRLSILFRLRHGGDGVPLGELATMLNVSPRNVTGLVDHLERDGLVARVPDPADRRSVLATLTDRGRERVDAIWSDSVQRQLPATAGFTEEELRQLRHLSLRLVENLRNTNHGKTSCPPTDPSGHLPREGGGIRRT